ncbi:MAG: M3 family oligoendopeptidase [Chloroflexi bacterium]|nr:M3 family oligoendopeptidase [Chloroflexota bacterium]
MLDSLPQDVSTLMRWTWPEIEPCYQDLAAQRLNSGNMDGWLKDWTALDDRVSEIYSRLQLATTIDTADRAAEERLYAFLDQIYPAAQAAEQKLKEKLLASGLEPAGFELPLRKMRVEAEIFREANLPLESEEQKLAGEYNKIISRQTVQWEGKERTISQLRPVFYDTNRGTREQAWRMAGERQLADRAAINDLWQRLLALRLKQSANADKGNYREYRWQQLHRFDYTPDDCVRFHHAIEVVVVPAAKRLYERRRERLGLDTLRPWDLDVDPFGRQPLRPFDTAQQLETIAGSIFHRVDSQLGDYFDIMVRESLLDLENRKNKAPGAFCTSFPMSKRPFVFANAVGLHDDLQSILHESGHAFHTFERNSLPYSYQREVGAEFSEVASMSMELLATPFFSSGQGGAYTQQQAAQARTELLEKNILFWPYMAVVDAFQHWVYLNPRLALDPDECDAEWAGQWERFMAGVDWSGLDPLMMTGWHRKLHIFRYPFYYIEYGLAQLGAMQIWANALKNQGKAVADYRRALALGGTISLPDLYSTAGARFAFDADTLGAVVALAEETISTLDRDG